MKKVQAVLTGGAAGAPVLLGVLADADRNKGLDRPDYDKFFVTVREVIHVPPLPELFVILS